MPTRTHVLPGGGPGKLWDCYHWSRERFSGYLITEAAGGLDWPIAYLESTFADDFASLAELIRLDFSTLDRLGAIHLRTPELVIDLRGVGRPGSAVAVPPIVFALRCRPHAAPLSVPAANPMPICPVLLPHMAGAAGCLLNSADQPCRRGGRRHQRAKKAAARKGSTVLPPPSKGNGKSWNPRAA